jgi:hypothetical protein
MLTARWRRTLALFGALTAVVILIAPASAGRAWCRADPIVIIGKDIVDIQVSSSLEMYKSATGPIEMVVTVPRGTKAQVLLQDFGFGKGYNIKVVEGDNVPAGARASVAILAPAANGSLPVTVSGTRLTVDIRGLLRLRPNIVWLGSASGNANGWVVLPVY